MTSAQQEHVLQQLTRTIPAHLRDEAKYIIMADYTELLHDMDDPYPVEVAPNNHLRFQRAVLFEKYAPEEMDRKWLKRSGITLERYFEDGRVLEWCNTLKK